MRRFIYLDTDALNSYLAQIFDGLIQNSETETSTSKKKEKQNQFSGNIANQIAFKLFGKGIDTAAQATYEHIRTIADDEIVRDVQTKIMHDNAFTQFMEYLQKNGLLNQNEIGKFISIEDNFYIFDIAFYQNLFRENGFVDILVDIQKGIEQQKFEQQFADESREQRRSKNAKEKIAEMVENATLKSRQEFETTKKMVNMLAAIIPYPQIMCISNYVVVLNEKFLRDDLSTAAFKYGGKIKVVGYITNKVTAQANSPISAFAGIGNSINTLVKIFLENADEMYIVHPVAIYYEDE